MSDIQNLLNRNTTQITLKNINYNYFHLYAYSVFFLFLKNGVGVYYTFTVQLLGPANFLKFIPPTFWDTDRHLPYHIYS